MIDMSKLVTTESVVRLGLILSDQTLVQSSPHWGDQVLANGVVKAMPHRQIALALGRDAMKFGVLVVNHHSFGYRQVWAADHAAPTPGVWDWYSRTENQFPPTTYDIARVDQVVWGSATSGASIHCLRCSASKWLAHYSQRSMPSRYAQLWADMR